MSVRSIFLRKLIQILFSPANRRVSGIRKDIREELKRSQDATAGGSDFLRVLFFRNVSASHLAVSGGSHITKGACAGRLGFATGCGAIEYRFNSIGNRRIVSTK
jgi:hypothetical protein